LEHITRFDFNAQIHEKRMNELLLSIGPIGTIYMAAQAAQLAKTMLLLFCKWVWQLREAETRVL
jgi:hypothetical protein